MGSIQNLFLASSNLSAPQYSPLFSAENGSSEETHCSEDITSSSSDITSGNCDYTSGIQVDLNVQHPLTKSLMLSTSHTSSPAPIMIPQIQTTQPMASPPSTLSPPSTSSHPSTLYCLIMLQHLLLLHFHLSHSLILLLHHLLFLQVHHHLLWLS